MSKSTRKPKVTKAPAHKGGGKAHPPWWLREILAVEELNTSTSQIDPWRGQLVQLNWDYCV